MTRTNDPHTNDPLWQSLASRCTLLLPSAHQPCYFLEKETVMATIGVIHHRLTAPAWIALLTQLLFCAPLNAQAPGATSFPAKPVRVLLPVPPGGLQDTLARGVTQELSRIWGQSALVENRPGAGGITAAEAVAKSAADGYTLLMADGVPLTITPFVVRKLPYDAVKDFIPVVGLVQASNIVIAPPNAPYNSIPELIATARAKPGSLNYGSFGQGSANHLGTERFAADAGVSFTHIPYKGGVDIMRAIMAGDVQFAMTGLTAALPLIKQGRMKALAWSGKRRLPTLPDVPTISEGLPGFDSASWFGWFAPAGTPPAVVQKIASDVLKVLATPEVHDKFVHAVGLEPLNLMPDAFAQLISSERVRNEALVKRLGLQQN